MGATVKRFRYRARLCSCSNTAEPNGPGRLDVAGVRPAHSAGPPIAPPRSTSRTGSGVPPFSLTEKPHVRFQRHRDPRPRHLAKFLALTVIFAGAACGPSIQPPPPSITEAGPGFCDQPDDLIRRYLVAVDVAGWTSASGVATIRDGQLVVLTNRHNLPPEPDLSLVTLRNHRHAVTVPGAIVATGSPLDWDGKPGTARDFVVLTVRDPDRFRPLPIASGRHDGPVVVPSFAGRRFSVHRGMQRTVAAGYDQLDFSLAEGSSGAPVLTCRGEIAGLYTARIIAEDWRVAGFKGIGTPITEISVP